MIVTFKDFAGFNKHIDVPLVDAIAQLQDALAQIPEEHRSSATLRVRGHGRYAVASLRVEYETESTKKPAPGWLSGTPQENELRDETNYWNGLSKFLGNRIPTSLASLVSPSYLARFIR